MQHGPLPQPQELQDREWTSEDVQLIEEAQGALCRNDLYEFRRFVRPNLIWSWWQWEVARHLMQFWEDLKARRKPMLIMGAPPQHGKTEQVTDFIAWASGQDPNVKTIFASYSDELGMRVNMSLQRMFDNQRYLTCFPNTRISETNTWTASGRYLRNSSIIEFIGWEGSFRNTTVLGQINGFGLGLGIVDDPLKGRKEAYSKTIRDSTWNWLTDDFFLRFAEDAGMIMIMTRWHLDDPVGRWLERFPQTKVLKFPAIAEHDEPHRKRGEPLFKELKSADFLARRRAIMTQSSWEAIYQQNPITVGGGMFPGEMFEILPGMPRREIKHSVRYIDKAGSRDGGAFTAMVLMHECHSGRIIVEDVKRGQWSALERETRIEQVCKIDASFCDNYEVWVEQEPGSGGKESAEATIRRLRGLRVFADRVTGSKETRAEPYAAQVQAGNVALIAADWNRPFLEEHEEFPAGRFKDQVDASSGAFNKLAAPGEVYDHSGSWIDGRPV